MYWPWQQILNVTHLNVQGAQTSRLNSLGLSEFIFLFPACVHCSWPVSFRLKKEPIVLDCGELYSLDPKDVI